MLPELLLISQQNVVLDMIIFVWMQMVVSLMNIMNDKFWKAINFIEENKEETDKSSLDSAINIFWKEYWFPIHGDDLPLGIAIACFDSAVHHGVNRTMKWMKQINGSWRKLIGIRRIFMIDTVKKNPSQKKYLKGWLNRLNALDKYITILEQNESLPS